MVRPGLLAPAFGGRPRFPPYPALLFERLRLAPQGHEPMSSCEASPVPAVAPPEGMEVESTHEAKEGDRGQAPGMNSEIVPFWHRSPKPPAAQ